MDFVIQSHPIKDNANRNDLYFSQTIYGELNFPNKVSINGHVFSASWHKNIKDECVGITSYYRSRLAKSVGEVVSITII